MRALTLVFLALLVIPASARAANPAHITGERKLDNGAIELTIATPALSAPTRVQVFLPKGYDAGGRWPVLYYLHGAQGDEARFFPWYGDLIAKLPAILVAPAGGHVGFYTDWYNDGAFGPPRWETYGVKQLLPLIDARFRTTARRSGRALFGESMGGYGVMRYAARHPDKFVAVASLSGFGDSDYPPAGAIVSTLPMAEGAGPDAINGPRLTQEVRWHGHNPKDLADNLHDVDVQVRTAPGVPTGPTESGDVAGDCVLEQGIRQTAVNLHDALTAAKVDHVFKEYEAGCHTIPTFRLEFTDALPQLERVLADPPARPRRFRYRTVEPRFSIWGWTIRSDPKRALEFLQLRGASRRGITLTGSGTTTVTTPRFFRGHRPVAVTAGGRTRSVVPRRGRLRLTVDLGPAHAAQQYTPDASGQTFTTRRVTFARKKMGSSPDSGARSRT
jgi:S-formylglutathione hydrolase FrmB